MLLLLLQRHKADTIVDSTLYARANEYQITINNTIE